MNRNTFSFGGCGATMLSHRTGASPDVLEGMHTANAGPHDIACASGRIPGCPAWRGPPRSRMKYASSNVWSCRLNAHARLILDEQQAMMAGRRSPRQSSISGTRLRDRPRRSGGRQPAESATHRSVRGGCPGDRRDPAVWRVDGHWNDSLGRNVSRSAPAGLGWGAAICSQRTRESPACHA